MEKATTHAGLDVHKRDIQVAMLSGGGSDWTEWTVANEPRAVRRLAKKLQRQAGSVHCAYEAGPCGYALQRQLVGRGC